MGSLLDNLRQRIAKRQKVISEQPANQENPYQSGFWSMEVSKAAERGTDAGKPDQKK